MTHSRFILVGGGARSGKSAFALRLARSLGERRVFVATAEPFDDEMRARIRAHQSERAKDFRTVEAPVALEAALLPLLHAPSETDVVVVDCLTLWISNLLLQEIPSQSIESRIEELALILEQAKVPVLLVTNEVGMGLVPETRLGREFRDLSGRAHQRLAPRASEVYLAALGCILRLKPAPLSLVDQDASG